MNEKEQGAVTVGRLTTPVDAWTLQTAEDARQWMKNYNARTLPADASGAVIGALAFFLITNGYATRGASDAQLEKGIEHAARQLSLTREDVIKRAVAEAYKMAVDMRDLRDAMALHGGADGDDRHRREKP